MQRASKHCAPACVTLLSLFQPQFVRNPKQPGGTHRRYDQMDTDILGWTREQLIAEVVRLRNGIRAHRDSSGHDLCWFHPALWSLVPEPLPRNVAVPAWPQFLRGCVKYREALDRELPDAPRTIVEADDRMPEKVGE
jgi:hypothetical protein